MSSETDNYKKLSTFFSEEYRSLRAYAQSRIDNATDRDAEDIVQDVALKVFSRANGNLPIENIAGFVYRSIRNKVVDILRTRKLETRNVEDEHQQITSLAEEVFGEEEPPYGPKLNEALKTAITNLKPPYRDIIIAIDFEGYSYREVSQETQIPEGTLMSRRHRAISLLFKALENKTEKTY